MKDIIIISGAPGSGKSSLGRALKNKLDSVEIPFSDLRNFHLDKEWKNKSEKEEKMSYENLLSVIRNYLSHDYHNVIVHDLQDFRVAELAKEFPNSVVITLLADSECIRERIEERKAGWKDVEKAIAWDEKLRSLPILPNEHRIETTQKSIEEVLSEVLVIVG